MAISLSAQLFILKIHYFCEDQIVSDLMSLVTSIKDLKSF